MSQKGKVALVTGGAQGIGRAFVESLLAEGASVAVLDVNTVVGEATVRELSERYPGNLIFLKCDVTNNDEFDANKVVMHGLNDQKIPSHYCWIFLSVRSFAHLTEGCFKAVIKKYSRLDIVINNAGVGVEKGDHWEKMIDINFTGVVRGSKLGLEYMGKDRGGNGGTIVNIGSITALVPFPPLPVYAATKAAVNHFTRSYGHDVYWKRSGVKVVAINPGLTTTPLAESSIPEGVSHDPVLEESWNDFSKKSCSQNVSSLGQGLIEILQKCENGSLWTIEDNKAPVPTVMKR